MAEHMRISLIDPKWREQREAMLSKIRDTTKASDDEITRNLVGLAHTRPDIFGSTEEEVEQMVTYSIIEKQTTGEECGGGGWLLFRVWGGGWTGGCSVFGVGVGSMVDIALVAGGWYCS